MEVSMSVKEFERDLNTRKQCYACLSNEDDLFPVRVILGIDETCVASDFPCSIRFSDGINCMTLSQIKSIVLSDGHYEITCGDDPPVVVYVHVADTPMLVKWRKSKEHTYFCGNCSNPS